MSAPLTSDSSVPDSTMSRSPSPEQPIRRSAVTYGRRHTSNTMTVPPAVSETRKRSLDIVPDSEIDRMEEGATTDTPKAGGDTLASDEDLDREGEDQTRISYSWRRGLLAIDAMDDDTIPSKTTQLPNETPLSPRARTPLLPSAEQDFISGSSVTALPSLSPVPSPAPLSPTPRPKRTGYRNRVIHSSPSRPGDTADETADSSPPNPYPIGTPLKRSSQTPPTSDEEQEGMLPMLSKGKGKRTERARTVPSLEFQDATFASSTRGSAEPKTKPKAKTKAKAPKIKAPTKKQLLEAQKESARLRSDQRAYVPTTTKILTPTELFGRIGHQLKQQKSVSSSSSDPIRDFSSPSVHDESDHEPSVVDSRSPSPFKPTGLLSSRSASLLRAPPPADLPKFELPLTAAADSDSDSEMPSVAEIFARDTQARQAQSKQEAARLIKQRALAQQTNAMLLRQQGQASMVMDGDDDDDDLEVVDDNPHAVAREEAVDRRTRVRPTSGKQRQLEFALGRDRASNVMSSPSKSGSPQKGVYQRLADAARPVFAEQDGRAKGKTAGKPLASLAELNKIMIGQATQQARAVTKRKEEEWIKRGGYVRGPLAPIEGALDDCLEKALQNQENSGELEGAGDEDEDEDEDYVPDYAAGSGSDDGDAEGDADEQRHDMETETVHDADNDENEEDSGSPVRLARRPRPHHRPKARVVDSDAEESDEENARPSTAHRPSPSPPPVMHRLSPLRFTQDDLAGDADPENDAELGNDTDKENISGRMYDWSENKENTVVPRHAVASTGEGSFLSELVQSAQRGATLNSPTGEEPRSPFKELVAPSGDLDDPFADASPPKASRLASPLPSLQPAFGARGGGSLSAFFDDDEDTLPVPGAPSQGSPRALDLLGSFDDEFEVGTMKPKATQSLGGMNFGGGLAAAFEGTQDDVGFDALRKGNTEFSLTLDENNLAPALEVSGTLVQKADQIFEKEQEYILEADKPAPKQKPELYVNDYGFLTQTRPNVENPEIYRPSPSQRPSFFSTQTPRWAKLSQIVPKSTSGRKPLGVLSQSFEGDLETPSRQPPRRLRRKASPSMSEGGYRSSPSPSPSPSALRAKKNAFDTLNAGARRTEKQAKKKLERSEFIEGEAVESDEDDMFGFGDRRARKGGEEEEDDDDGDKVVENLVDDADMSEDVIGRDLVLEKVQEHQAEDDAAMEKIARDAVEGKLRSKRRGHGVGMDGDSSDEDDDYARELRRQQKKRKIDGDNLEDLGKHKETAAFHATYYHGLIDEGDEFKHLQQGDPMDEDEDGENAGPREAVSIGEITRRARELAQEMRAHEEIDPEDVSWVEKDADSDEEHSSKLRVRFAAPSNPAQRRAAQDSDFLFHGEPDNEQDRLRMLAWQKTNAENGGSSAAGFGGSGGSVTGLGRQTKAKTAARRVTAKGGASEARPGRAQAVRKEASILASVGDRRSRFGN
ncbi:MRC1-like domain-containing protein [Amylostereum chailletii]|nr:MRC1-like domain-containing protein [Amylostereum chailletii]